MANLSIRNMSSDLEFRITFQATNEPRWKDLHAVWLRRHCDRYFCYVFTTMRIAPHFSPLLMSIVMQSRRLRHFYGLQKKKR